MRTNWKERLNNWAPEPPADSWEKLSASLPETTTPVYAQKLYNFNAAPPPAVWEALEGQLSETPEALPAIKMFPRQKWLRVASVAASVLVGVFFLRPYFSNQDRSATTPAVPATQQSIIPIEKPFFKQQAPTIEIAANRPQQTKSVHNTPTPTKTVLHLKRTGPMPTMRLSRLASASIYQVLSAAAPRMNNSLVDRYIVLASEDAVVRLPKKLYGVYRCDDNPDEAGCLERLAALQRQMAAPSLLAPADFMGLLEVIRKVDD